MSEVDAEAIDKASEIKPIERRRSRRRNEEVIVIDELDQISGKQLLKILEFLHRKNISWLTEVESAKYSSLYKSARDDALKDMMETYSELQKQNQELIDKMAKLIEMLESKVQPSAIAQQTAQEIKKSILDDPRIRTLIAVGMDVFLKNNEAYQKYRPLVICTLMPEACQERSE